MKKQYFDWDYVFEFICQRADTDGLWDGDAITLSEEFNVSEDDGHSMLSDLCDRGLIEKVYPRTYAITNWRERDDPDETC